MHFQIVDLGLIRWKCSRKVKGLNSFSGGKGRMNQKAGWWTLLIMRLRYTVAATSAACPCCSELAFRFQSHRCKQTRLQPYRRCPGFIKFSQLTPKYKLGHGKISWPLKSLDTVKRGWGDVSLFMWTLNEFLLGMIRESPSHTSGSDHLESSFQFMNFIMVSSFQKLGGKTPR